MAERAVRKRARKVLGEEPLALVWCEIHKPIPAPPKDVHRAAGKGRLKPGHHWLLYVGGAVFFFVVVPWMLIDKADGRLSRRTGPRQGQGQGQGRGRVRGAARRATPEGHRAAPAPDDPAHAVFDGNWSLAASPRRHLSPTRPDDFSIVAEFPPAEARVEAEPGRPRGFATFRIRFADGSWIQVGRLGEPEDADHFLRTAAATDCGAPAAA
ncbi:hypothetical protein [Streptomyces sp. NPDC059009]|uniref:hypothetical protein n=1 Tax=Streptomyces sp. NPDC059009 TaxID=3346694 RepID=UPI00368D18A1